MNELELSDPDIIKIIKNAFSYTDTIRVDAGKDSLTIFGVDDVGSTYTELILNKDAFSKYDIRSKTGVTVSLNGFKKILEIASSEWLTKFRSLIMSFHRSHINFKIKGEVASSEEKLLNIPTGIIEPPPLPNFAKAATCESDVTRDFRLGFTVFKPDKTKSMESIIVSIEIPDEGNYIEFKPSDPTIRASVRLKGETRDSARTATSVSSLDSMSKVVELEAIKKLKISLIDKGSINFFYQFEKGELNYIATSMEF